MRQVHRALAMLALAGLLLAATAATGNPGGAAAVLAWTASTRRRLAREPV